MKKISLLLVFLLVFSTGVFAQEIALEEQSFLEEVLEDTSDKDIINEEVELVEDILEEDAEKVETENGDTENIEEVEIENVFLSQEELENKIREMKVHERINIYYNEEELPEIYSEYVGDSLMLPIRTTLERMGYNVEWNQDEYSVELSKGAVYTKIHIGSNSYFKNKMSNVSLTQAPTLINEKTFVPLEFFYEILSVDFKIESNTIYFTESASEEDKIDPLVVQQGTVVNVEDVHNGIRYHIATGEDLEVSILVTVKKDSSIHQRVPQIGELVNIVGSSIMLMSYPGQTQGFLIY